MSEPVSKEKLDQLKSIDYLIEGLTQILSKWVDDGILPSEIENFHKLCQALATLRATK